MNSILARIRFKKEEKHHDFLLDLDPELANEKTIYDYVRNGVFYEPEVSYFLTRCLRPGDLFVDVGANIGYFAALASLLVGYTGRVLAYEPAPNCLPRLKANLDRNGLANVTVIEHPLADEGKPVTLWLCADNAGGNSIWDPGLSKHNKLSREQPQPIAMQAFTLDRQLRNWLPPRAIKVDVEGAEHLVLQGARKALEGRRIPFIIAELNEFGLEQLGSTQDEFRRYMADFGYDTFVLSPDDKLPKLIPLSTRITSRFFQNLLFSRLEDIAPLWPIEVV